jgi:hypothetical protein
MDITISEVQINTNSLLSSIKLDVEVNQKPVFPVESEQALPYTYISDPIISEPYSLQRQSNSKKTKTDEG